MSALRLALGTTHTHANYSGPASGSGSPAKEGEGRGGRGGELKASGVEAPAAAAALMETSLAPTENPALSLASAFLPLLGDAELPVRKQALLTFSQLAHCYPLTLARALGCQPADGDAASPGLDPLKREDVAHGRAAASAGAGKARDDAGRGVLLALYRALLPDPALVVTTDYGPFTRTVDQGLPLRKAAYSALLTLVCIRGH